MKASTKKKRQKVEVKVEPGVYNRPLPTKNSNFTVNQELQVVAIEQSEVLMESRAKDELNNCIIAMHTKKVAGKKALIEEAKFFVLHSTPEDPNRPPFVQKLMVLNEEFASGLDDLTRCELAIIESMGNKGDNENATKNK